jgi:hypothetical protein
MLVWLIDAVPQTASAIARLAFRDDVITGPFEVATQIGIAKGRLDAFLVGDDVALVIESKLESVYGDDQIARYLRWLGSSYPDRRRGLVTLTAYPAPWSASDRALADELEITPAERRWEEIHDAFGSIDVDGPLAAQLVSEFLDMLEEEDLIPMRPLDHSEFARWPDAYGTIERFHGFFFGCRDALGDALSANPASKSTSHGYVWQDFTSRLDATRILVGPAETEGTRVSKAVARNEPIVFLAVSAEHWPDWPVAMNRLEAAPPPHWRKCGRLWGQRPQVWRHLGDVIRDGTFEDQRSRLASACSDAVAWLQAAELAPVADSSATTTFLDTQGHA